MKIAFDENVPVGMVRVFQALANERQLRRKMGNFEVVSATDYVPSPSDRDYVRKSDIPWLQRFADDGGKIVISGDRRMLERPHELLALQQCGFVVVVFERRWSEWDFFKKCSLLLHYWPAISRVVKSAKAGRVLRIPSHYREDGELLDVPARRRKISKVPPGADKTFMKTIVPIPSGGDVADLGRSLKRPRARAHDERQTELEIPVPHLRNRAK